MKNLIHHPFILSLLLGLLKLYMCLIYFTTRWQVMGKEEIEAFWKGQPIYPQGSFWPVSNSTAPSASLSSPPSHKGGVCGFWHGRLLMVTLFWSKKAQKQAIMSSLSKDGNLGARAAQMAGMQVFRGSATNPKKKNKAKRTLSVYRELLKFIKQGGVPFLTLDGPRGPRMRGGTGLAHLSKLSGAPIILFSWSKQFRIVFKSWDRFILPLPFGRGVAAWTVLPPVPKNTSQEELKIIQEKIEMTLNELCARLDQKCGVEIIRPKT